MMRSGPTDRSKALLLGAGTNLVDSTALPSGRSTLIFKEDHQWRIQTEIRTGWRSTEKPFWRQTAKKSRHASPKLRWPSRVEPGSCGTPERQKRVSDTKWTRLSISWESSA